MTLVDKHVHRDTDLTRSFLRGEGSRYFSLLEFPPEAAPAISAYHYTLRLDSSSGALGSGILIRDGCVLTCSHVVAELKRSEGSLRNLNVKSPLGSSQLVGASIAYDDSKLDFAIVNCPGLNLRQDYPVVADPSLYVGDRCYLIGNPSYATLGRPDPGKNPGQVMSIGIIEDYDGSFVHVSAATINPGHSGGAIVAKDGSLIAMISEQFRHGGRGPSLVKILGAILESKRI